MNYIFWGSFGPSGEVLKKLIEASYVPVAVVTSPDRPLGRKKVLTPPPVKVIAESRNIKVLQPDRPQDLLATDYSLLKSCDLFIAAMYPKIIPRSILSLPHLGVIGVHPSLLPRWRGPSPVQSAILRGDKETGVTIFVMDEKMDHGDIISSAPYQVSSKDTSSSLTDNLARLGAAILIEALPKFLHGNIKPVPQDHSKATITQKFTNNDAFISPEDVKIALGGVDPEKATMIDRKIRAMNPEPGTWTWGELGTKNLELRTWNEGGKRVKLLESEVSGGKLVLRKVQVEGKTPRSL